MSRIDDLINEKCPNGVKYTNLFNNCDFQRGQSITIKNMNQGSIPVIAGGQKPSFYCNQFNRDGEYITIAGSGAYAGCVNYWNSKIMCTDCFTISSKNKKILNNRYLYHFLLNIQEFIYDKKKGAGIPHVHISSIDKMIIPIPPIEVQEEIVKILDKFSELEAELEA
ncbi:MAG: restriction endonuclease subunit S, partial [Bacilli bacterium]